MAVRRALFSKPAWAAKASSTAQSDQTTSIFQQNVYEDILQEQRRKEQRKALKEKAKGKQTRREDSEAHTSKSDDDERIVKKRRVSKTPVDLEDEEEEGDDFDKSASDTNSESDHEDTKNANANAHDTAHTKELKNERLSMRSTRSTQQAELIDLDRDIPSNTEDKSTSVPANDDDDDLIICEPESIEASALVIPPSAQSWTRLKPPVPPPPDSDLSDSDPDEDEHIKALKRKARREARLKSQQATSANTDSATSTSLPNRITEPEQVHILIRTILPSCPPIGIIRRPSQTLESVHIHFCTTHSLSENLRSKVFFTWNNQRLFRSTTARSILDQIKRKHGGVDKSEGKIVLEAVTEEIFEHRLAQRERERKRLETGEDDAAGGENMPPLPDMATEPAAESVADPSAAPSGVVIKLTNPNLPLMALRVHAHTTVEKIVRGYKKRRNIDMGKEVYLVFEGEKLDEKDTVGDVGFEDEDVVDVRVS